MAARSAARKARARVSVLDREHARFIQQGVSIVLAACDAARAPTLARAYGCHVARDRSRVTLYVCPAQCVELLEDLEGTGQLAAVFSDISSHRTIQLKSNDARCAPLERADRARVRKYQAAFTRSLGELGYGEAFASTFLASKVDEIVAVTFTPSAIFGQTPGPNAGAPLA